jgi:hypothetical protein
VVPTLDDVLAAHEFLRRRYRLGRAPDVPGIGSALALANRLAAAPADEPAAIFYAFARFPKALGGLWRVLPAALAVTNAHAGGRFVDARRDELEALLVPIASQAMTFDVVRAWFAERIRPLA